MTIDVLRLTRHHVADQVVAELRDEQGHLVHMSVGPVGGHQCAGCEREFAEGENCYGVNGRIYCEGCGLPEEYS